MIVNDHRTVIVASVLALGLSSLVSAPTLASEMSSTTAATTTAAPAYVTVVRDGVDYTYWTNAHTVRDFLVERDLRVSHGLASSSDPADGIFDGLRIVLRPATAQTRVARRARDVRIASWTARKIVPIAQHVKYRTDSHIAVGTTQIVEVGRPGLRESTFRYVRYGNERITRTFLATRIVRMPRERVIARGVAAYTSLARVAEAGFASAVRFAGSAIHMIATAYTAGCYGCSGVTASGVRAGFGVIAVDPRVIPLGTKLFIPGYGRAVAGDTGGAILGNRVDLGMDTRDAALRYGRRSVTVYVLR